MDMARSLDGYDGALEIAGFLLTMDGVTDMLRRGNWRHREDGKVAESLHDALEHTTARRARGALAVMSGLEPRASRSTSQR